MVDSKLKMHCSIFHFGGETRQKYFVYTYACKKSMSVYLIK